MLSFDELIEMAHKQPEPQRILFVFAKIEYREGHGPEDENPDFSIEPHMYNDKTLKEITNFQALVDETVKDDFDWQIVFVAGLGGSNGALPTLEVTDQHLQKMVDAIYQGVIRHFAAYDRNGKKIELFRQ
jgi:predicted component of type VI protein secretion system